MNTGNKSNTPELHVRFADSSSSDEEAKIADKAIEEPKEQTTVADDKSLNEFKEYAIKCLEPYTGWYKLSFFGHHHEERAKAVMEKIRSCEHSDDIWNVLYEQKYLFDNDGTIYNTSSASSSTIQRPFWSERYSYPGDLLNKTNSSYYQAIVNALKYMPQRAPVP